MVDTLATGIGGALFGVALYGLGWGAYRVALVLHDRVTLWRIRREFRRTGRIRRPCRWCCARKGER